MIFIAGDIHGTIDIDKVVGYFSNEELTKNLTKQDYLILLGDTSICWDDGKIDTEVKHILRSLPVTTLFIDGNHDNHRLIAEYPVLEWNGGLVHEIEPDILHLMRGEVFTIAGKKFFAFGGAHSIDQLRRTEGVSWWPEEMPNKEEYERGIKKLNRHNNCVDYILTHTAPAFIVDELGLEFMEGEEELQRYLEEIAENVGFKKWFCGHFHEDMIIEEKYHVMMDEIIQI